MENGNDDHLPLVLAEDSSSSLLPSHMPLHMPSPPAAAPKDDQDVPHKHKHDTNHHVSAKSDGDPFDYDIQGFEDETLKSQRSLQFT